MKKNKLIISDVTLRDGNHAVNHSISKDIIIKYCREAEKANIKINMFTSCQVTTPPTEAF